VSAAGYADLVRAALAAGRPARVPVSGTSMMPALAAGTVLVEPAGFDRLRPGEVVAYQHRDRILVHRIVAHQGTHLLTAGDNLPLYDPLVPRAAVLGRVPAVPARPAVTGPADVSPLPAEITVWLAGAVADPGPLPFRVRHLAAGSPLPGEWREPGAVTAGVSPAAIRPLADLPLLAGPGHRLDIVLGCRFGRPGPAVLAPGDVGLHLRAGPPLCETSLADEIQAVLAVLAPAGAR
jgi:hypothetical protein